MNALAIHGGAPVRTAPMPAWPHFSEREIAVALDVLRSGKINYWTGPHGREFEREFAAYLGRKHAIALANGTVALEAALLGLQIGPGDEVIVPCRTFIATASSVVARGAVPVVADVDADTGGLTVKTISAAVTPRTRAIIAVHLGGWPCDIDAILLFARARGLKVIEDCAQCHGARLHGRKTGSFGDVAAFSFCQDKIMTTCGEGGMVVTDDDDVWRRMWSYKDHGKDFDLTHMPSNGSGFRYVHQTFGTNWRMTEMQAAVGRVLLQSLDAQVAQRRANAAILQRRLSKIPGLYVPQPPAGVEHSYYKFYALVRPELLAEDWNRDKLLTAINAEGVPCFAGSCSEIYLENAFTAHRPASRFAIARQLGETSLMFLVHPTLTAADMQDTCTAVEKVCAVAISERVLEEAA